MTMLKAVRRTMLSLGCLALTTLACGWAYNTSDVEVLTTVNVPTGGGSASVMFQGIRGQQVLVSLTGKLTTMQPFAELVGPDGGRISLMQAASASAGFNSAQVAIPNDGVYRLDVFDGSGQGGAVTVRVEITAYPTST